ncbi:PREDICTED: uncharacterized protein LOC104077773 [Fulmarus glacialis]|uniref:uncharacterized protein LOC104077773 n=1 Tax=Fulmarus glacialis TaxID=30455 RepID=UPI00051B7F9E|nr:PREDICTED: uncharacterized protein LOC104077773 [Fulmarus glacialis]
MLHLVGVLLSCGALCIASPVPPAAGTGCAARSLIQEILNDIQTLNSEGSSKITPLNNMMEVGGNVTAYLEGFIEALKSSEERSKERLIVQKLQKIQDAGKSCLRGMGDKWEPVEEEDFFMLHEGPSIINEANIAPENEKLQLTAKIEDLHSTVIKISYVREQFFKPLHVQNESCAHNNTEKFIHELKKISACKCMKRVEKDMERLEEHCSILKKSSINDKRCLETAKTNFSQFKETLKKFLKWINGKQNCSNIVRSESGLYPDGKCSCRDPWKYRRGLL